MRALIVYREYGDPIENSITGPTPTASAQLFTVEIPLTKPGTTAGRLIFRKYVAKVIQERGLFITTHENMTEAFVPWHEIVRIEELP